MLTIHNIEKIVGKRVNLNQPLVLGKIVDVIIWVDGKYEFKIEIETPHSKREYPLILNRNKIPNPIVPMSCWEITYEWRPNQYWGEMLGIGDMEDMWVVIRRISNLMDRILNSGI